MERRNWSLKALKELRYIDSLDEDIRAHSLNLWSDNYLNDKNIEEFDLELQELQELSELFYKNISFLKSFTNSKQKELTDQKMIKKFLK